LGIESWQLGEVPDDWKKGSIAPLFEKGRKEGPGNYQPFSFNLCAREYHGIDLPGSYSKAYGGQNGELRHPAWLQPRASPA